MIAAGLAAVALGLWLLTQRDLIVRLLESIPEQWGKLSTLAGHVSQMVMAAQRCHRPAVLAVASALSVLAWGAEALAFHWVLSWMGADIPLAFSVFVYAMAMLAGALSFMPGGLGGAEAAMIALLVWKGMPSADAIAATVLIRLATLWFAVVLGAAALFKWR